MQGKISVFFKDGSVKEFYHVHYLKYSYELESAEIGYSDIGSPLIQAYRVNLKQVAQISIK